MGLLDISWGSPISDAEKEPRIWEGHGNIWKEQDGDMPSCFYCNKTIEETSLGDAAFNDIQCCEEVECRLKLADDCLTEITLK